MRTRQCDHRREFLHREACRKSGEKRQDRAQRADDRCRNQCHVKAGDRQDMRKSAQSHSVVGVIADAIALACDQRRSDVTRFASNIVQDAQGELLPDICDRQHALQRVRRSAATGTVSSFPSKSVGSDTAVVIVKGEIIIARPHRARLRSQMDETCETVANLQVARH